MLRAVRKDLYSGPSRLDTLLCVSAFLCHRGKTRTGARRNCERGTLQCFAGCAFHCRLSLWTCGRGGGLGLKPGRGRRVSAHLFQPEKRQSPEAGKAGMGWPVSRKMLHERDLGVHVGSLHVHRWNHLQYAAAEIRGGGWRCHLWRADVRQPDLFRHVRGVFERNGTGNQLPLRRGESR